MFLTCCLRQFKSRQDTPRRFTTQSHSFLLLNIKLFSPPTQSWWARHVICQSKGPRLHCEGDAVSHKGSIGNLVVGGGKTERSLEKMRQKRIREQGDTRTNCQGERECVCMSSAREDENEMFLRPRRGKESFYVDSGETSLMGTSQSNAPERGMTIKGRRTLYSVISNISAL